MSRDVGVWMPGRDPSRVCYRFDPRNLAPLLLHLHSITSAAHILGTQAEISPSRATLGRNGPIPAESGPKPAELGPKWIKLGRIRATPVTSPVVWRQTAVGYVWGERSTPSEFRRFKQTPSSHNCRRATRRTNIRPGIAQSWTYLDGQRPSQHHAKFDQSKSKSANIERSSARIDQFWST